MSPSPFGAPMRVLQKYDVSGSLFFGPFTTVARACFASPAVNQTHSWSRLDSHRMLLSTTRNQTEISLLRVFSNLPKTSTRKMSIADSGYTGVLHFSAGLEFPSEEL